MANLLFKGAPATDGTLVFGADDGAVTGDSTLIVVANVGDLNGSVFIGGGKLPNYLSIRSDLAPLGGTVGISPTLVASTLLVAGVIGLLDGTVEVDIGLPPANISATGLLGDLGGEVTVIYASQTERPLVSKVQARWQHAAQVSVVAINFAKQGAQLSRPSSVRYQSARRLQTAFVGSYQSARPQQSRITARFQNATNLQTGLAFSFQSSLPTRESVLSLYTNADDLRHSLDISFQQGLIRRNSTVAKFQAALQASQVIRAAAQKAGVGSLFTKGKYQEAIRPPVGRYAAPIVVPEDACYVPDPNLVFSAPWSDNQSLLFYCERHTVTPPSPGETVIVPIRKVYLVLNTASLRRIDGNLQIATFGMSLSLDVDSWTWQFSSSMPAQMLPLLEPDNLGNPVEVEALVNGSPYRMLVESISRERVFGQSSIRVSGRGIAATLDAPYAAVQFFGNTGARTAQQLMTDILTINNVSLGWTVNWSLSDWLVPAGIFNHKGSYISAINSIAASAGGYVQPSGVGKILNILPRYKAAPWNWATAVTPDYQLPGDVMTRESIEWVERARYNRVFVSGQGAGVIGQVTRAGTAGEVVAPMIVDSLITHADAARQRGIAVLGNTGRIANISLKLPVLAETNIITPGKYVDFVDSGVTRRGVVRSVQVEVGLPEVWQTIGVETHA